VFAAPILGYAPGGDGILYPNHFHLLQHLLEQKLDLDYLMNKYHLRLHLHNISNLDLVLVFLLLG
jgi:hypothetical protein